MAFTPAKEDPKLMSQGSAGAVAPATPTLGNSTFFTLETRTAGSNAVQVSY